MKVTKDENGKVVIDLEVDENGKCKETCGWTKFKDKVKGFCSEHEAGVKAAAVMLGAGVLGTAAKNSRKKRKETKRLLEFAKKYGYLGTMEHINCVSDDGHETSIWSTDHSLLSRLSKGGFSFVTDEEKEHNEEE